MFRVRFAAIVAACLSSVCAFAADLASPAPLADDGWIVTLKGNVVASPAYDGANHDTIFAYPSGSIRKANTPATFGTPDDGIGFALYDVGWLKAGPVARFKSARRAADHPGLAGVRDVDWTIEAGAFAEIWPMESLRGRVELRRGFHGHTGLVADLGLDWVQRRGPWTLSLGPRATFGNDRFMRAYFGVTPAESLANGYLPPHDAKGGLESVGVMGAATYQFSPAWSATGYARYDRLVADAGSSPLVTRLGSKNQVTLGAILAYSFAWRGF